MTQTPSSAPLLADATYAGLDRRRSAAIQPSARRRNRSAAKMYVRTMPSAPNRAAVWRPGCSARPTAATAIVAYAGTGGSQSSGQTRTNTGRNLPASSRPPRAVRRSTAAVSGFSFAAGGGSFARYEYNPSASVARSTAAATSWRSGVEATRVSSSAGRRRLVRRPRHARPARSNSPPSTRSDRAADLSHRARSGCRPQPRSGGWAS